MPMTPVLFVISALILIIVEALYFNVAHRLHIGASVTPRSSHRKYTATGGGIVYIAAAIIYIVIVPTLQPPVPLMLAAMGILAAISFIDDVHEIAPGLRLAVQTIVVAVVFGNMLHADTVTTYLLILLFTVGLMNAFNFMDGINGILALYTMVTLGTITWILAGTADDTLSTADTITRATLFDLSLMMLIATAVFACFNLSRRFRLFSGDVGAIAIGFFVAYALTFIFSITNDASVIVLVSVYIIDTLLTIIQRLFAGEHIMQPHRRHLYQMLTNNRRLPHLTVAATYAGIQLAVNIGWLVTPQVLKWTYTLAVFAILASVYFKLKRKKISHNHRH